MRFPLLYRINLGVNYFLLHFHCLRPEHKYFCYFNSLFLLAPKIEEVVILHHHD
jgi:hypothetical protein